tara:strand:+ start:57 stop:200 length:144 start_codon:yes stop_codon:yes gene_type:complete
MFEEFDTVEFTANYKSPETCVRHEDIGSMAKKEPWDLICAGCTDSPL